jgi:hypothetical protein
VCKPGLSSLGAGGSVYFRAELGDTLKPVGGIDVSPPDWLV